MEGRSEPGRKSSAQARFWRAGAEERKGCKRTAERSHRARSPLQRSLELLDELTDPIVVHPLLDAQRARLHCKLGDLLPPAKIQGRAQQLIHEDFEGLAGPSGFSFYSRCNIFVQGECGSHILMLSYRHQDVNDKARLSLADRDHLDVGHLLDSVAHAFAADPALTVTAVGHVVDAEG